MISDAMQFLKDNLEYIQYNDFIQFFHLAEDELGYKNMTYLRDLFYRAGIDPLLYLDKIPDGYYLLDNMMTDFVSSTNSNIKKIGYKAVSGSDVQTVTITSNIEIIDMDAFSDCGFLQRVTIQEGCRVIDEGAFYDCEELFQVSLPRSIIRIGAGVFNRCESLKQIDYAGTKADWYKIKIHKSFVTNYVEKVNCTDGVINLI